MSATKDKKAVKNLVENLHKKTKFSREEIHGLLHIMGKLCADRIDKYSFREFLHKTFHMTEDILMDGIFKNFDKDSDGYVSEEEWVEGLSVVLTGTWEEKLNFCFRVYDLAGEGYITRENMFNMLSNSLLHHLSEEDPEEGVREIVDYTLKKLDLDLDGRVSLSDYEQAVSRDPLMMEAFGQCLPDKKSANQFLESVAAHQFVVS